MEPQNATQGTNPTPLISPTSTPSLITEGSASSSQKNPWPRRIGAFLLGVVVSVGGFRLYEMITTPVAAVVNGTRIIMEELDRDVEMMKKGAALQGVDIEDPLIVEEIKTQALNNLITNVLLLTAAQNAGMKTDQDAIDASYQELATSVGGEEALLERMTTVGLTKETLMANISDRLVVDQYLEAETDIDTLAVTDEEIEAYVAQMTDAGLTMPPLEEVSEQIKASLLSEKQQVAVNTHIEKLHADADIEIKVDGAVTAPETNEEESSSSAENVAPTIDGK